MRITTIWLHRNSVLSLVGSDFSIFISILIEIDFSVVSNHYLFIFIHRWEGIVKPVALAILYWIARITRHFYGSLESNSVTENYVFNVYIFNSVSCCNLNGVSKYSSLLIIRSSFSRICLARFRILYLHCTDNFTFIICYGYVTVKVRKVIDIEYNICAFG